MKKIILGVLLVFVFSIGAVCACDTNDTFASESSQIPEDLPRTFTELSNDINASEDTFDVHDSYTFNSECDKGYVEINKNDFTINGNNHVIDGNGQSGIFNITGNNVTISNLIFKNGKSETGGIIDSVGEVTLRNVTFIANNVTYTNDHLIYLGGAIANHGGKINCYESRFIDNYAESGSAIFIEDGQLNVKNTNITSSISNKYGQIWARYSTVNIDDVDFIDISSIYSPAISIDNCENVEISNSRFINLTADISAGAISLKQEGNLCIKNCKFINTKSFRNAGAVIVDYGKDIDEGNVIILDCIFDNSSSMIGGAYIQLGGVLLMNNSNFTNSRASYDGGAVYLSFTDSQIDNCIFTSNDASLLDDYPAYGGAIYCDMITLELSNSRFINNSADLGNAIYACDSDYSITNCIFANNTNAIFTDFDEGCNLEGNDYNNDSTIINQTYSYKAFADSVALEWKSLNNSISVASLPSYFDLRDWGWVTPVKHQGHLGSCWTFAMISSVESALLKAYGVELNLSESNLMHSMLRYSHFGNTQFVEGGKNILSVSYLVNWFGPLFEEEDIYDEVGKISPFLSSLDAVHVQNIIFVPNDEPGTSKIKSAILNYGALVGNYYVDPDMPYYNPKTFGYYANESEYSNHEISIIGWDDKYSADNFLITPPGDGAWIIKNSWGTDWGNDGFFYISYYDNSFLGSLDITDHAVAVIIENEMSYNKNYQHDFTWSGRFDSNEAYDINGSVLYANQFVAADDDLIAGVGTFFNESGVNYTVEIYVNNQLKLIQNGISPFLGYHTIKLNEYVSIKKGDVFKAVMTSNSVPTVIGSRSRAHYSENMSFLFSGEEWIDFYAEYGNIACLKVFTVNDTGKIINNRDITVEYDGGSYFSVNVLTSDGHNIVGAPVKFEINGKPYSILTDRNGVAKIQITDVPGTYAMTTTFNGKTYKNTVTVKHVLKASNVKVKKTAKKFSLKATLKINGKVVKGKWVTFKFKGKTYKVKTNSKGIAQKTFKKNVIKKLKKGKTYSVKVTYLKDTIKTTVKVK